MTKKRKKENSDFVIKQFFKRSIDEAEKGMREFERDINKHAKKHTGFTMKLRSLNTLINER